MQPPGDPTDVDETFETMTVVDTHAELVTGPGGSYWVVIHPAGTLHDPSNPDLYLSLTLEALGWLLNRTVFRRRWTVRIVAAERRPILRRTRYRRRVPESAAPAVAMELMYDVRAGLLPPR
jgi:hypothetical protein